MHIYLILTSAYLSLYQAEWTLHPCLVAWWAFSDAGEFQLSMK